MVTIRAAGTLDLTVHARDPDVPPSIRPSRVGRYRALLRRHLGQAPDDNSKAANTLAAKEHTGHAGATVCGLTLALDALWVDYTPEPRDPLCPACFGLPAAAVRQDGGL